MRTYGLIGYPLTHSFSKKYFENKFERDDLDDVLYELYPLERIDELDFLIDNTPDLRGLNVTIPYKERVLPYLHDLDEAAQKIGAVNTIKIDARRRLTGFNTDAYGFKSSIKPLLKPHHTHALVLGTGGASKAAVYVLQKMGILCTLVSRKPENDETLHYKQVDENTLQQHTLIVNTTPLGMYPNIDTYPPIPYEYLNAQHLLFDMVYNPETTLFLIKGKQAGATIKNGLEMLQIQADKAWEIWNK